MVFKHAARKLWVTPEKDLLCIDEVEAIVCYEDESTAPVSLIQRFRLLGIPDVTTVSTTYSSACALGSGGVFCAERRRSSGSGAIEELRLTHVDGLASPTKLWSTGLDFMALDGTKIIQWDDRGVPAPKHWGALAPGDGVYDGIAQGVVPLSPRRSPPGAQPSLAAAVRPGERALAAGQGRPLHLRAGRQRKRELFRLLSRRQMEPFGRQGPRLGLLCQTRL